MTLLDGNLNNFINLHPEAAEVMEKMEKETCDCGVSHAAKVGCDEEIGLKKGFGNEEKVSKTPSSTESAAALEKKLDEGHCECGGDHKNGECNC